jgi:hypothetical protein
LRKRVQKNASQPELRGVFVSSVGWQAVKLETIIKPSWF